MVEHAARGFGDVAAPARFRLPLDAARFGPHIRIDDAQRLLVGQHHLHGPGHDALEGIVARERVACVLQGLLRQGRESVQIQVEAGQGAGVVAAVIPVIDLHRVGASHMVVDEVFLERLHGDVQPLAADDAPLVHGVFVGMAQGDQLVVGLEVGEFEGCGPGHGLDSGFQAPCQVRLQGQQLLFGRRSVESPHRRGEGMDLPTADDAKQIVADLLHAQAHLHGRTQGRVRGHADGAFVAQKIGRVEEIDVQGVALDPFCAVEQPPQRPDLGRDLDAQDLLHGVGGAHLIGHRADAADARGDVRRFHVEPPLQEGLEKPGRLEDLQLQMLDLAILDDDIQRALAFHARHVGDIDSQGRHAIISS